MATIDFPKKRRGEGVPFQCMLRMVCIAVLGLTPKLSSAGSASSASEPPSATEFFVDGGMVPFFYGSLAATLGIRLTLSPPKDPRFFSDQANTDGSFDNTVPEWAMGVYGAGLMAVSFVGESPGRWVHLQGYMQAVATTLAVTELAKNVVGRRRPHFLEGASENDLRRSFFSGHSSVAWVTSLYAGLYLQKYRFSRKGSTGWRGWEYLSYAALATVAVTVPFSRVSDRKHHLSDVVTGGLVGAVTAGAFFWAHDKRVGGATSLSLVPTQQGFSVVGRF